MLELLDEETARTEGNRKQFPRPIILTPDDDRIGRKTQ
jgi:hypothetical protein